MAQRKQYLIGGVLIAAIAAAFIFVRPDSSENPGLTGEDAVAAESGKSGNKSSIRDSASSKAKAQSDVMELKEDTAEITDAIAEEMKHTIESKRAFLRTDYRNFNTPVADYKMENMEITAEGIRLSPPVNPDDPARVGVVESPGLPLMHPSNSVVPLWRSEEPDNTSMQVEIAVSADNKDWSRWYHLEAGHEEISPTFPDGSPNPNFGAKGAVPVGFGMALYPYVKYRVSMSSNNPNSPVLQAMDFYHNDTTDGAGYLANNPPPEQGIIDAAGQRAGQ